MKKGKQERLDAVDKELGKLEVADDRMQPTLHHIVKHP